MTIRAIQQLSAASIRQCQYSLRGVAGVVLLLSVLSTRGQDIHFSQFYAAPLSLNPARTGLIHDYHRRAGLNYRDQWNSIRSASPFTHRTFSAFYDQKIPQEWLEDGWPGVGVTILSDRAGDGRLSTTQMMVSGAFHQKVLISDYLNTLSGGISVGYIQKKIDYSKLYFGNQWQDGDFNTTLPAQENRAGDKMSYLDVNLSAHWTFLWNKNNRLKGGVTVFHLNQPEESFYQTGNRLGVRTAVTMGGDIRLTERIDIMPRALYMGQTKAQEFLIGVEGGYRFPRYQTAVLFGPWYRGGDALILVTGIQYGPIIARFSYDLNLSPLKIATEVKGGPELSIIYKFADPSQLDHMYEVPCKRM